MHDAPEAVSYREASAADAPAIAALHADSWRRNYRGAYPEDFFDGSLDADRAAVWSGRLSDPQPHPPRSCTVLAELSGLAGFVHVRFDEDERWGSLVDNLHVRHDVQRHGIASELMRRAAAAADAVAPGASLHLWVLEQNTGAQAFYRAIGGRAADRQPVGAPANPGVLGIRMVWDRPRDVRAARG